MWYVPVAPATREAEAQELLEPGKWRLLWAEMAPLHSSLGDRARLCLKQEINKEFLDMLGTTQDTKQTRILRKSSFRMGEEKEIPKLERQETVW